MGELQSRNYVRKPGKIFYETSTTPVQTSSNYEKAALIKRHLGINNNDGWEVLPFNIVVEGEEDKKYLEVLLSALNRPLPNIVWSGGASKIAGYLQYYEIAAKELPYKPVFCCIFDNDDEGREQAGKIKPSSFHKLQVNVVSIPRYDGKIFDITVKNSWSPAIGNWEIEDFIPCDLMFETINKVIKKEGYKIINKYSITNRNKPASINKQILKYAEECCAQTNPEKDPFILDNEGRKKQICQSFCELQSTRLTESMFSKGQIDFLTNLVPKTKENLELF